MTQNYKKAYVILRNKQLWGITPGHPMYCCRAWIEHYVNHIGIPITYDPARRFYYMMIHKEITWKQIIRYCMCCRKKFPKSLTTIRDKILKKEYGITDYKTVRPEEFHTEEWWLKRGL